MAGRGAFRVLSDGYVTEESGTGVVHQAPYFGEDDYRVCLAAGVITKDMDMICPVDARGCFTDEVTHFKGLYVKVRRWFLLYLDLLPFKLRLSHTLYMVRVII